jgi:hypothetical protein
VQNTVVGNYKGRNTSLTCRNTTTLSVTTPTVLGWKCHLSPPAECVPAILTLPYAGFVPAYKQPFSVLQNPTLQATLQTPAGTAAPQTSGIEISPCPKLALRLNNNSPSASCKTPICTTTLQPHAGTAALQTSGISPCRMCPAQPQSTGHTATPCWHSRTTHR